MELAMSKIAALYFNCLNWQPENIKIIEKYFDITLQLYPDGGRTGVEVVFWPVGYKFIQSRYPDVRYLVMNTSFKPTLDNDQITIISNWDSPEVLKRITATAEHTLGLILAIHRKIPAYNTEASWGMWDRRVRPPEKMLSEMQLCIWGAGRIGTMLSRMASPLFQKVTLIDIENTSHSLTKEFQDCDVLAITASVRKEDTQPILNKARLRKLKNTAIIVNTARGELVDNEHLISMLEADELDGVALDVLPDEFEPGFSPMYSSMCEYARTSDNLILTPHIGGSTTSAWSATENAVILDLINRIYEEC
jgi:D-3-phosphoglycerate dehydrogenase